MKSQKGITLVSLVVYVVAFLMVSGIIAGVTTFFYNNYSYLNRESSATADFNKISLSLSEETKKRNNGIYNYNSYVGSANKTEFLNDRDLVDGKFQTNMNYETKIEMLETLNTKCKGFFNTYVLFTDGNFVGFVKNTKSVYYNQSLIGSNVKNFKLSSNIKNGRKTLNMYIEFENKSYTVNYTLEE